MIYKPDEVFSNSARSMSNSGAKVSMAGSAGGNGPRGAPPQLMSVRSAVRATALESFIVRIVLGFWGLLTLPIRHRPGYRLRERRAKIGRARFVVGARPHVAAVRSDPGVRSRL